MTIRSRMISIMGVMGPESLELFALELKKKNSYVSLCIQSRIYKYQPISTNLGQNMTVRSRMSSIFGVIGPEQLDLFALEIEKLIYFTLFTL